MLATEQNIDFDSTAYVDLGDLTWNDADQSDYSALSRSLENLIKKPSTSANVAVMLDPVHNVVSRDNLFVGDNNLCVNTGGYLLLYLSTNAGKTGSQIKASLKGILLAYQKTGT